MNPEHIAEKVLQTKIKNSERLYGGDINETYSLETERGNFVVKINRYSRFPEMFAKEKNDLEALRRLSGFRIPKVEALYKEGDFQFLFMEKIETGRPESCFWEDFGKKLAAMHRQSSDYFGWETDNFMGNRIQHNNRMSRWEDFFRDCRVMPLVKILIDQQKFSSSDGQHAEKLCRHISGYFPSEPPAFIHGDLWNGNFMIDENGFPVLIDPAVSYSHREMDLGLTRLFGGFSPDFYFAYQEHYPLVPGWEKRLSVAQLYPLLFHAVAFGGSYIGRCREILAPF